MNRVTKVTDHTSIETDYTYDKMGRTSTVTYDPTGANRVTSFTYDGNSNVDTVTYANGYTSTFTYDNQNRVTQQLIEDTTPTTLVTQQIVLVPRQEWRGYKGYVLNISFLSRREGVPPPASEREHRRRYEQHDGVRRGNEDSRLGKPCYVGIALERAIKERKSITQTLFMRPARALSSSIVCESIFTDAGWKPALR